MNTEYCSHPRRSAQRPEPALRVLKVSHSSVVGAWRQRERELLRSGLDVTVVAAARWVEGGRRVEFEAASDGFAVAARTWGRHPNLFLWDPRPLWGLLGQRWDVLDVHEEPCSLATAELLFLRLLRRARMPVVLYSAQNIHKRYPPPFRWTERAALRRVAAVSVCNRAAGQILQSKGFRGRVAEIPLGVDVERYAPADRPPPNPTRAKVGYVGRLAHHKGVDVLLRAAATHPTWTLELVGGGPDEARLRNLTTELELTGRVSFAGPVAENELPGRYAGWDAVAVPSLPTPAWEEQFGRVVVEAMAAGVPVVASDSGALPDVVGDAGVLVPPGDPVALGDALEALMADGARWASLRTAGLARAARCSWSAVATDYGRLYREVAE